MAVQLTHIGYHTDSSATAKNVRIDQLNQNSADVETIQGDVTSLDTAVGMPYSDADTISARITDSESAKTDQDGSIGGLNTAVGVPYISASDLDARASALEAFTGSTRSLARFEIHGSSPVASRDGSARFVFDYTDSVSPDVQLSSDGSYVTIQTEGAYFITGACRWTGSGGAGARALFIVKNMVSGSRHDLTASDTNPGTAMSDNAVSTAAYLVAGETVCLNPYQNSGGTLDIAGGPINNLCLVRL